jgi:hypothetical protein
MHVGLSIGHRFSKLISVMPPGPHILVHYSLAQVQKNQNEYVAHTSDMTPGAKEVFEEYVSGHLNCKETEADLHRL